jgi:hypothetical protein
MPADKKYGHVTLEYGDVGEDEPVIVFRAQDKLAPLLLSIYADLCQDAGSPQFHQDLVTARRNEFTEWQASHPGQVRVPASADYQARMNGPQA